MSGGYYEYAQYHINDIANAIEEYINGYSLDEEDINDYIKSRWLEDKEKEYIRKNKHTKPNPFDYNKETIKELKKGLAILRKAYIYAQRIEWLLSGDDGEESFHKRLKEELDNLKNKKNEVSKT